MAGVLLWLAAGMMVLVALRSLWLTVQSVLMGGGGRPARKKRRFEDYLLDDTVAPGGAPTGAVSASIASAELLEQAYRFANDGGLPVLILYGTEYGFSREVAYRLAETLRTASSGALSPRVMNMLHFELIQWSEEPVVLVVCSTTGDGVVPSDARPFADQLESGALTLRPDLHYSVLALGDKGYPHFCRAGKHFEALLRERSGQQAARLAERSDIDQEDWHAIEAWFGSVQQALRVELLHALGLQPHRDYLRDSIVKGGAMIADLANDVSRKYTKDNPYWATMVVKRPLTVQVEPDDKETVHIELDLGDSGIRYVPGDALGVVPRNCPAEVRRTLAALHMSGIEQAESGETVREFLERRADLKNLRPELLFRVLADSLSDVEAPAERQRASQLWTEAPPSYLRERELADVLLEFPSARIAPHRVPQMVRALQPRFYSIASSPVVHGERRVALTVAVVRYRTLGRDRQGVTTCYLADRVHLRDTVPVFLSRNPNFRLPVDDAVPIVMIGPGTGIAPFRAFAAERRTARGRTLLFFGSRHRERDFLYRDELEEMARRGELELYTAFSRDQSQKYYVQHRMLERAADLCTLIDRQGAYVYVCGDALHMARDVDKALRTILREHAGLNAADTDAYMERLEREARYQRDVWVE
ncbi:hypothetical protein CDCA_CDCA01G0417 [Cyanidium caldarium]|uniref:Uncharacterized protein n=1 Tax=Cyanidium caldarium TaxID=2771 RepID=A0AAV9IQ49_CYACA|nr:hypothetical protein CDCA_CDCA01G0417 [Cyanidium caldarium]